MTAIDPVCRMPVEEQQQSIALNASFFNTHRMVQQYLLHSYALGDET